jgi:hypothetical protein
MDIGSITSNTASALQATQRRHHHGGGNEPSFDNTAKLLGMSADDLQTQLRSGKTLNDLASAQGVSSDDLMSALKSDLTANKPAGAPALSDDQLTKMATDIAAGKRPHGPPRQPDASSNLQSLAQELQVSPDALLDAIAQGAVGSSTPYTQSAFAGLGGASVDEYA